MNNPEDLADEPDDNAMAVDQEPLNVAQCTDLILEKLHENGQIYWLRRFISNKMRQTGWTANLRHLVVEYIKAHGPNNVNVTHMWSDLAHLGIATTPDDVKVEVKKYLDQIGQQYIEVNDSIEVTPDPKEDEKLYQMQSRDAVPEPPTGLYPPPSPSLDGHTQYVKPPWLFVYDKPKPPNEVSASAATNGSETGDSDNYDSSCESPSSPYSNTPPDNVNEEMGEGDQNDDDDGDDIPSPGSLDSRGEVAGVNRKTTTGKPYHREKERDRERKKRLEKARQRDRKQIDRTRSSSNDSALARTSNSTRPKTSDDIRKVKNLSTGQKLNSGLISPQLSIPLRQLKLDKKTIGSTSTTNASNTSKLSPPPPPQQPSQPTTTHHKANKNDTRRTATELVEEEEEEELMDV